MNGMKLADWGAVPGISCAFCGEPRSKRKAFVNSPKRPGTSICETCVAEYLGRLINIGALKIRKRGTSFEVCRE